MPGRPPIPAELERQVKWKHRQQCLPVPPEVEEFLAEHCAVG